MKLKSFILKNLKIYFIDGKVFSDSNGDFIIEIEDLDHDISYLFKYFYSYGIVIKPESVTVDCYPKSKLSSIKINSDGIIDLRKIFGVRKSYLEVAKITGMSKYSVYNNSLKIKIKSKRKENTCTGFKEDLYHENKFKLLIRLVKNLDTDVINFFLDDNNFNDYNDLKFS